MLKNQNFKKNFVLKKFSVKFFVLKNQNFKKNFVLKKFSVNFFVLENVFYVNTLMQLLSIFLIPLFVFNPNV